jgi:hypothetical protein
MRPLTAASALAAAARGQAPSACGLWTPLVPVDHCRRYLIHFDADVFDESVIARDRIDGGGFGMELNRSTFMSLRCQLFGSSPKNAATAAHCVLHKCVECGCLLVSPERAS